MNTGEPTRSDGFDASRAVFDEVVVFLDGVEAAGMDHAELEDRLAQRSRELFCRLFPDHLDRRAQREPRLDTVTDAEGIDRPNASPTVTAADPTSIPPTGR